jgi:phage shock protein PspC (stress-responsive transcriptional regulator)
MNKTVTINISGIIFHIEEDAYEKLSKYLSTIKGYFSKSDGGSEIMSDIEARIAEMLQGKTSAIKQVVLMSDVDFVMDNMGKPEEFAGDEQANTQNTSNSDYSEYSNNEPIKRRLYRDGDSKVLGGVCSGIGHYFGFDPVWLRIALALLLVFAGTGVLIYIILWIAIPEAKTMTEKLAMKGEKADINNISKAVKEEAEQLKKRMEKYGKEFSNMASNSDVPRNAAEKFIDFLGDVLGNVGKVLLKIVGVLLVVFGIIFFLGLTSSVFGLSFMMDSNNGSEWIDMLLLDGKDFYIGIIGIAIFAGTPIIMMIYGGIKILFKINYRNRWVNLSAGIIWLVGFLMLLYVGIKTGSDFNKTAKMRENITITPYNTLYLKMHETPVNSQELNFSDNEEEDEKGFKINRRGHDNNYMIGTNNGMKYLLGHAQLNIIKSQTDKVELVVIKEAKGGDKHIASERAKNIFYNVSQVDSLIQFDNLFKVNNADKFRVQDVTVILKVPVGKIVYLDKSLESIMYDIENVTNTYDGDMLNHLWIMTTSGLKCLDCDGITDNSDKDNSDEDGTEKDVKITVNGVDVDNKDVQVKLDTNGIHIHTKKK